MPVAYTIPRACAGGSMSALVAACTDIVLDSFPDTANKTLHVILHFMCLFCVIILVYGCSYRFTFQNTGNIAIVHQIKHNKRHIVIHAKRRCSCIHNVQVLRKNLAIRNAIEAARRWIFHRIAFINAVNFGSFQQAITIKLTSTQGSCCIGSKIWITCSSS